MRCIDVLIASATTRRIESYESTLELNVSSSRGGLCFDSSLKLRDRIISALEIVGLSDSEIQEGGAAQKFYFWGQKGSEDEWIAGSAVTGQRD